MNDVKKYLRQIEVNEDKLEITRNEIRRLKSIATTITPSREEKVQSSLKGDKIADNVVGYTDLELELKNSEREYFNERIKRINYIFNLDDALHIKILYKKYAEYKAMYRIAQELGMTEQYIKEEHNKAIKALENMENLPKTY